MVAVENNLVFVKGGAIPAILSLGEADWLIVGLARHFGSSGRKVRSIGRECMNLVLIRLAVDKEDNQMDRGKQSDQCMYLAE